MKKLILTTSMVLSTLLASSQIFKDDPCVTCHENTIDLQNYSSAIGTNNTSTGERSFAGGINSQATGNYSFAFGNNAEATGLTSFAFGNTSRATDIHSFALGNFSEANGRFSVAIGRHSKANGDATFSLGYNNIANGPISYLFGEHLQSSASSAFVIGRGAGNNRLVNNQPYSMMVGFNSTIPTLFISESKGTYRTGKIGIGNVTDPAAKLHIKADDNEHATLRLEPTGTGKAAIIELCNEDYSLIAAPGSNFHFKVPEGKNFNFQNGKIITSSIQINQGAASGRILKSDATGNTHWADSDWTPTLNNNLVRYTGNVGIGFIVEPAASLHVAGGDIYIEDITHGIIMKSPNGQCWRGTLTDQGNLQFSAVTCPGLTTGSKPEIDAPKKIRMYPNPASTQLHIESEQELRNALVLISSLDGRSIKSQQVTGNAAMLDISGLARGAYIVNILENEVQIATQQLIVQ